jgi:arylsulfatase A-like enzyme
LLGAGRGRHRAQNVGEHATWCKMSLYEHSLRVAMMIKPATSYAGGTAPSIDQSAYAGQTYSGPVELLDIYKTTIDLAGLPGPQKGVEGDSLVPGDIVCQLHPE